MTIIPRIAGAMEHVLATVGDTIARGTGFVKRKRKLSGAKFVQTLVFTWLAKPNASLEELTQTAASLGVRITPQALEQRFTPQAAELLKQVLGSGVAQLISAKPVAVDVLQRFAGIYLDDSTTIILPDELASIWSGCGGSDDKNTQSALKLQIRWNFSTGALTHLALQDGRDSDQNAPMQQHLPPVGALRIADLGYFNLDVLAQQDAGGSYWLSRLKLSTAILTRDRQRIDIGQMLSKHAGNAIDIPILLGAKALLPVRLLAQRVPDEVANQRRRRIRQQARRKGQTPSARKLAIADWTLLVTNASTELLSLSEAMVFLRVRWQIELLFKLFKSHTQVDTWQSQKPWRILCEVYAKLVVVLIQHWLILSGCWQIAARSLTKAAQTVSKHALHLAVAFASGQMERLIDALLVIANCLSTGCRLNPRKTSPNTYQLLLALTSDP